MRMQSASFEYTPRHPEESVLYQVVAEQLETLLARQQERDRPVPLFVEREFRTYLTCGIAEHGFLRLHCDTCGHDRILPFSCKKRAWCPSRGGRRMADTAAHLVERVFPWVPVRQWVLSLPFQFRYRMAYDSELLTDVLNSCPEGAVQRAGPHGRLNEPTKAVLQDTPASDSQPEEISESDYTELDD